MYSVSTELYEEAFARLKDAIGGREYFSGTVCFEHDGIGCRLVASVIVCRERVSLPEGVGHEISDLVPVWWEFHTEDPGGEMLNDFSFSALRSLV